MFRHLIDARIEKFSSHYNYDASYLQYLLEQDGWAFIKFNFAQAIGRHTGALPTAIHFAAVIRSAINEDCGPCVQLVADMALEAGVDGPQVAAIVESRSSDVPADLALAIDFANAIIERDAASEQLRPSVLDQWGNKGLIEFGLALTSAKLYPDLKYTLGYGQACSRVMVGDHALVGVST